MGFVAILEGMDQVATSTLIGKGCPTPAASKRGTEVQQLPQTWSDPLPIKGIPHTTQNGATIGGISSRQSGQI
jgi:hypothetical protein